MDFKKYSAAMLAVVLLSLALLAPVSAANAENTAPADKIDSALQEKLDSMSDLDTIDVSVWLCDIDYEEVEQEVTQRLERKAEKGEISGQALLLPEDDLQTMKQQNSGNAQLAAVNFQPVDGPDIPAAGGYKSPLRRGFKGGSGLYMRPEAASTAVESTKA